MNSFVLNSWFMYQMQLYVQINYGAASCAGQPAQAPASSMQRPVACQQRAAASNLCSSQPGQRPAARPVEPARERPATPTANNCEQPLREQPKGQKSPFRSKYMYLDEKMIKISKNPIIAKSQRFGCRFSVVHVWSSIIAKTIL
jgi:hypothetical protein